MNTDPFDTLGIAPTFSLDRAELERRQRELSKALHPDRHANAPRSDRRHALSRAIDVNDAYRKLKDPVRRGEALLGRLGQRSEETPEQADPEFLMEVMELREALSNAGQKQDLTAIDELAQRVRRREQGVVQELETEFSRLLASTSESRAEPASHEATQSLRTKLGELRYYRRFLDEANALLDELD